jgi:MFS superfamily sulfate permease-like transporter
MTLDQYNSITRCFRKFEDYGNLACFCPSSFVVTACRVFLNQVYYCFFSDISIWIKSKSSYDTTLPALDTKLLGEIFLTSFFTAFIGLFESLLTMQIIDELT